MNQPDTLEAAAKRFIAAHQGEHLSRDRERLVERCAAHLVDAFYLSPAHAKRAAQHAVDELQGTAPAALAS
jgi:hypothetical protein